MERQITQNFHMHSVLYLLPMVNMMIMEITQLSAMDLPVAHLIAVLLHMILVMEDMVQMKMAYSSQFLQAYKA